MPRSRAKRTKCRFLLSTFGDGWFERSCYKSINRAVSPHQQPSSQGEERLDQAGVRLKEAEGSMKAAPTRGSGDRRVGAAFMLPSFLQPPAARSLMRNPQLLWTYIR